MPQHGTQAGWAALLRGTLTPGLLVVPTSVSGAILHAYCTGSKELASSSLLAGATISCSPGLHTTTFGAGGFRGGWRTQGTLPATGYIWEEGKNPKLFTKAAGFVPTEGVQCCMPPAQLRGMGLSSSSGSLGVTSVPVLCTPVPESGT